MNRFELVELKFPSNLYRNQAYAEVIENVRCGFLWRKTRQVLHKVIGGSTVWHDFTTGQRVDRSPLSQFVQSQVNLRQFQNLL